MLIMTISTVILDAVPIKADGGPVIEFHYHRADGDYDPWSVWMWGDGQEGNDYPLEAKDGDAVAKIELPAGVTSVGFIVRTKDWAKDYDEDQFIDISEMISGTVIVKVESGVEGFTKEYGDDAVRGIKLSTAKYNGDKTITATMTGDIEGDLKTAFKVEGKNGEIQVADVKAGDDSTYTLTLKEELDNSKSYQITYDGTVSDIRMPIVYSTKEFEDEYTYDGDDLGATWSKDGTTFRVWAPTSKKVMLNLYETGDPDDKEPKESIEDDWDYNKVSGFTIKGNKGTAAERYARNNDFNFVQLQVVPTSVSLNKTALTLDVGKSYTLTKTVSPSNAVTSYTWSSSNTSVATVDKNGKVTAKASGTATITVKTSNGKTATCKVTVNLPTPQITSLANTTGGIKISWNKVSGAYGYRLYYKPASGGWKRFKDTTATSFTDSGVSPNRTETYTIRCIDKNGNTVSGFYSRGWSKKYTPVAPTITRLSNTSKGVSVTWNKIAGVYGYRLYRKYDGGSWTKVKDTTSTSFTDSGAKKGKKATYTVRCIDKKGKTVSGFNSKGWSITKK